MPPIEPIQIALISIFCATVLCLLIPWAAPVSLALILAGPILMSTVKVGGFTLDNLATAAGLAMACVAALKSAAIPLTRLSALPVAMLIAVGLSDLANGLFSWQGALRFLSLAMVPWLVAEINDRDKTSRMVLAILSIGALSILAQPITHYPNPFVVEEGQALVRYGGLFGHPNFGAYSLALAVLYIAAAREVDRISVIFVLLALAAMLVASSFTALVVLILCSLITLIGRVRRIVIAGLAAGGVASIFGTTFASRVEFISQSVSDGSRNSATWRIDQWREVLGLSRGREVLGVGWQQVPRLTADGLGAHSAYIQIVVELGFVGVALALVGAVISIRAAVTDNFRWLVPWIFVALTSVIDPVLFYPSCMAVLLTVASLMLLKNAPAVKPAVGMLVP